MVRDDKFVSIFKGHALLEKAERGSSASSPPPMYSPSSLSPPLRRASSSSPQAHIILFLQKASFVYLLALFEGTVLLGELFFARSRKAEVGRPSPSAPQGGHLALHPGPSELGNEETPFSPPPSTLDTSRSCGHSAPRMENPGVRYFRYYGHAGIICSYDIVCLLRHDDAKKGLMRVPWFVQDGTPKSEGPAGGRHMPPPPYNGCLPTRPRHAILLRIHRIFPAKQRQRHTRQGVLRHPALLPLSHPHPTPEPESSPPLPPPRCQSFRSPLPLSRPLMLFRILRRFPYPRDQGRGGCSRHHPFRRAGRRRRRRRVLERGVKEKAGQRERLSRYSMVPLYHKPGHKRHIKVRKPGSL